MLLIKTAHTSPRLEYALDVLFTRIAGIRWRLLRAGESLPQGKSPILLSYGEEPHPGACLHIPASGLLWERGVRGQLPKPELQQGLPILFSAPPKSAHSLSFDFFAAAFFMLSRYEEYLPFAGDPHGRFRVEDSVFGKAKMPAYPEKPLLHLWLERFFDELQKHAEQSRYKQLKAELQKKQREFIFTPTYDLDLPWAFAHKRPLQAVGGALRDLFAQGPGSLLRRFRVWRKPETDPWFIFPFLQELHKKYRLRPIYFAPTGNYGRYDKSPSHRRPAYRRLLRQLKDEGELGLHPSYYSSENPALLKREKKRLEEILDQPVLKSRQHYLRFSFPQTPRSLLHAGITDDYSLGFAERPGFRAGICLPFPWYDLKEERSTTLLLHPLPLMDVSLFQYLKLSGQRAMSLSTSLRKEAQQCGGEFITLWHNNNLANRKERKWYESLVVEYSI